MNLSRCLPNTSTFVPNDRSQCLYCVLLIMLCAFGAHLDVGLDQPRADLLKLGTFPSLVAGKMAVFDKTESLALLPRTRSCSLPLLLSPTLAPARMLSLPHFLVSLLSPSLSPPLPLSFLFNSLERMFSVAHSFSQSLPLPLSQAHVLTRTFEFPFQSSFFLSSSNRIRFDIPLPDHLSSSLRLSLCERGSDRTREKDRRNERS